MTPENSLNSAREGEFTVKEGDERNPSRNSQRESGLDLIKARLSGVKHKVIVLSGKGGVGKSTITANLAAILAERGFSVGVFDYDFHGPAIPRMLGAEGSNIKAFPIGILPAEGVLGIKIVSIGFLLPDEKTPVIWRGPLKYNTLRQFLEEVIWGKLDFLLFDLPPGTGDEALNIAQMIPDIDGAIVVTIPSEVSRVAVEKSAEFCKTLKIKLIGVIENMSYFKCPNCGSEYEIFGSEAADRLSRDEDISILGKVPLDPDMAKLMDSGEPIALKQPDSPASRELNEIVDKILEILESSSLSS